MSDTPTVFISNQGRDHNYSAASKFGAVRPVTNGNYPIFKTSRLQEEIIAELVTSTKDDYLLLSGSSVIAGMCLTTWMEMHGECKLLLWDRKEGTHGGYVVRHIVRTDLKVQIEREKDRITRAAGRMVR